MGRRWAVLRGEEVGSTKGRRWAVLRQCFPLNQNAFQTGRS